jgi:hypothetical protein
MAYINLDYGFVMDEDTKEVFRLKDEVLIPSNIGEYERIAKFVKLHENLWNDATDVDEIPDTALQDENNIYFNIEENGVSFYKYIGEDVQFEQKIRMIYIEDLEDIQWTGISQRGKFAIIKLLGLINEYTKDGDWHTEIKQFNNKHYKFTYRITENPVMSIKPITIGAEVKMKPKKKVDMVLDF